MCVKYLSIALVLIVAACGNQGKDRNPQTTAISNDKNSQLVAEKGKDIKPVLENGQDGSNGFWEKLVMVELKDANGMVAAIMPFPASWKIGQGNSSQGGASITGPKGLKVTDFPARSFMNNYDPGLQQVYAQSGQQMRGMPAIEQLVQQDFVPWAHNQGMQLVKFYEIPEVSKMDKWYSDQLFKAMPSRSDVAAIGIDWKKKDGTPYFMIVHLNVSTSNAMQNWYYMTSGLEADADYVETAKKQYIFALANTRYNLQPIMTYNEQEAQRVGQSWAAHNRRMAQNQANFEANQRAFVNKSEAINDAIMKGWREKNASSDRNQERFIDGVYERTNVQNTETGQQYKVAAGANQYWMNSNGEYISTQLNDYNPNLDQSMNEVNWQQLKEVKKD
jgi:hypothetical protein